MKRILASLAAFGILIAAVAIGNRNQPLQEPMAHKHSHDGHVHSHGGHAHSHDGYQQESDLGWHDHGPSTSVEELTDGAEFNAISLGGKVFFTSFQAQANDDKVGDKINGKGKIIVRSDIGGMTDELRTQVENGAHGQCAVLADGSLAECIPGCGLIILPPDLSEWKPVATQDARLKGVNGHGMCAFVRKGTQYIGIASNNASRVFIVDTTGKIVHELATPKGEEFSTEQANAAYKKRNGGHTNFCGVTYVESEDSIVAVTGYDGGKGDFALQAKFKDDTLSWGPAAHGQYDGMAKEDFAFNTAHGVSTVAGTNHVLVASRASNHVVTLELKDGKFNQVSAVPVGEIEKQGTLVCHASRHEGLDWLAILAPTRGHRAASVLIYDGDKPVGQVVTGNQHGYNSRCIHAHGVTAFTHKKADGTTALMACISFWPNGQREGGPKGPRSNVGAIVIVEVVPEVQKPAEDKNPKA